MTLWDGTYCKHAWLILVLMSWPSALCLIMLWTQAWFTPGFNAMFAQDTNSGLAFRISKHQVVACDRCMRREFLWILIFKVAVCNFGLNLIAVSKLQVISCNYVHTYLSRCLKYFKEAGYSKVYTRNLVYIKTPKLKFEEWLAAPLVWIIPSNVIDKEYQWRISIYFFKS